MLFSRLLSNCRIFFGHTETHRPQPLQSSSSNVTFDIIVLPKIRHAMIITLRFYKCKWCRTSIFALLGLTSCECRKNSCPASSFSTSRCYGLSIALLGLTSCECRKNSCPASSFSTSRCYGLSIALLGLTSCECRKNSCPASSFSTSRCYGLSIALLGLTDLILHDISGI